jgi:hypothetical protein
MSTDKQATGRGKREGSLCRNQTAEENKKIAPTKLYRVTNEHVVIKKTTPNLIFFPSEVDKVPPSLCFSRIKRIVPRIASNSKLRKLKGQMLLDTERPEKACLLALLIMRDNRSAPSPYSGGYNHYPAMDPWP